MRDRWISELRKRCTHSSGNSGLALHNIKIHRKNKGSYTVNRNDTLEWGDGQFLSIQRTAKGVRTVENIKPSKDSSFLGGLLEIGIGIAVGTSQASNAHRDKIAWRDIEAVTGNLLG
jgi:hypothetical protein